MAASESGPPPVRLPRKNPFALISGGREALREVPGLRPFLVKGFLLNYAIFILTATVAMGLIYWYLVQPISAGLTAWSIGEGFFLETLALLLKGLLWLTQLLLMAATLLLSLFFSFALMTLWFEALASRIVAHCRGDEAPPVPFSLGEWLAGLARSLRDSLRLIVLALLALMLGFIPVVGLVLVVVIDSFLLGWEIREPYLAVREEHGDDHRALRRGLTFWTFRIGLLPVLLAMIPFAGWLLLPALLIYMVAGIAWHGEEALRAEAP